MSVRYFAMIAGIVYVVVGLLGFLPNMRLPVHIEMPHLAVGQGYGLLFGLFPVNVLHNFVHLFIGIWGIAAFSTFAASRTFARGLTVIYGVLAVMGLIPILNTTFGLIPLFGHDIWLHALTAVVAAYFGFAVRPPVVTRG